MALPSANQAHWTARAFWVLSLVLGLISVQHACNLQCTLTRNMSWNKLWGWLNDERKRKVNQEYQTKMRATLTAPKRNRAKDSSYQRDVEKGIKCSCLPFEKIRTDSIPCKSTLVEERSPFHIPDLFAVLLISAPRIMLHYSVLAYTIGLGIYFGYVWKDQLVTEAATGDNESIFMFFLTSVAVCYPMYWIYFAANLCKNEAYQFHWIHVWLAAEVGITENYRNQVLEQGACVV